jgi:hypothetical protein
MAREILAKGRLADLVAICGQECPGLGLRNPVRHSGPGFPPRRFDLALELSQGKTVTNGGFRALREGAGLRACHDRRGPALIGRFADGAHAEDGTAGRRGFPLC